MDGSIKEWENTKKDFSSGAIRKTLLILSAAVIKHGPFALGQTSSCMGGKAGRVFPNPTSRLPHFAPTIESQSLTVQCIKCYEHPPTIPAGAESLKPLDTSCSHQEEDESLGKLAGLGLGK